VEGGEGGDDGEAVLAGHHLVDHGEVGPFGFGGIQRRRAVGGLDDPD